MDSAVVGDNNRGALSRREEIGGVGSHNNLPKRSRRLVSVHEQLWRELVHAQEAAGTIPPWIQPWWASITEVCSRGARELVATEAPTIYQDEAAIW